MPIVSTGASTEQHSSYSLRALAASEEEWDAVIAAYPTTTVFHSSAWLAMLRETTGGTTVLLEVQDGPRLMGYFCGQVLRKGPFRLLGSPLPGWGTPTMGPIGDPESLDQRSFLRGIEAYCRQEQLDLLEISCSWLKAEILRERGFRAGEDVTFSIELTDAQNAWKNINKTTRNCLRQAQRFGVRVEPAEDNEAVHEHYDQLVEVCAKWLSRPSYGVERPLSMWRHLYPSNLVLLRALHESRCVATYLLVYDKETMWGTASASRQDALHLRPNDLLHWKAIELACRRGLRRFDFCGGGDYKQKYGGILVPRLRWMRAFSPAASLAYRVAETTWQVRREAVLKLARWIRK